MARVKLSKTELDLVRAHNVCRIATVSRDGWPHCVPVGYVYRNGFFYIPTNKKSKKARNLRVNTRASIVIDDENERVLLIQGRAEVVVGERFRKLRKMMTSRTGWTIGEQSTGAILVLSPERKAAWKPGGIG
jgi:nitroimidazol reductase NimA-like FMN-containing flavoprotein (pyridoxamine 5'-phosphate oxidase superfamily)